MLTIYNAVKPFIVDEGTTVNDKESFWWKKWSNGFVEAGGQFIPSKYPKDQHGATLYPLPFRILRHHITLVSDQSNSTSTYHWRSGYLLTNRVGDHANISIRGKFVDFATGNMVPPDSYTEEISWSFSGYLET